MSGLPCQASVAFRVPLSAVWCEAGVEHWSEPLALRGLPASDLHHGGTIFEGTRKPLRTRVRAMSWVTTEKQGVSAGLLRQLGLSSYQTALAWLHKLRRAMVRPGRDRLSGRVEVDETYLGPADHVVLALSAISAAPLYSRGKIQGLEEGVHGRETEMKAIVAVAAEENGGFLAGEGTGFWCWRARAIRPFLAAPVVERRQCTSGSAEVESMIRHAAPTTT